MLSDWVQVCNNCDTVKNLCRCNFLGREVSLLMQLLEDADIPDPCASNFLSFFLLPTD
jgi:hypothetical protein